MGEIAGLATSFCWALTAIQFTVAGHRVGSRSVNRVRLALAAVFLSVTHLLVQGSLWPVQAGLHRWMWLGLSGIIGLVLGDGALFHAFLLIGPRGAMVLMTLVPVISAVAAWLLLGERLAPAEVLAILITVGGVAWVVSERRRAQESAAPTQSDHTRKEGLGVLLALCGALGQATGMVVAKRGLVGGFPALSATVMRMMTAAALIWLVAVLRGQAGVSLGALRDRRATLSIAAGAFAGPFVGVWLSLFAVREAPVGIASALMALSPIMLIPFDHWVLGEAISWRSVAGTLVALGGAAMILLT